MRSVHNDYTERSRPWRVRNLLPFDDPTSPSYTKPLESMETRTLAFFD